MGTQQKTASSNQSNLQFNPLAQQSYNKLIGGGTDILSGFMQNPFTNPTYQLGLGQSMKGAAQGGQNNMNMLNQLFKTSGMGGTAGQGFMAGQQAQMGRANQSMMSQANLANVQSALGRQMAATGMGMSFSPQMTGQSGTSNTTQSTSGLGTWLPQLMGAGLGMGMSAMSGMGGGSSPLTPGPGASSAAMPPPFSPMNLPSGSFAPPPPWLGSMGG